MGCGETKFWGRGLFGSLVKLLVCFRRGRWKLKNCLTRAFHPRKKDTSPTLSSENFNLCVKLFVTQRPSLCSGCHTPVARGQKPHAPTTEPWRLQIYRWIASGLVWRAKNKTMEQNSLAGAVTITIPRDLETRIVSCSTDETGVSCGVRNTSPLPHRNHASSV